MKSVCQRMALVLGAIGLTQALTATAQDWPQWRGPQRDAKVSGFKAPATWPKELTQKWKVTVGRGDATPALVGGRLYVAAALEGREVTLCLDAAAGKEIWREGYEALGPTGPASSHAGPRSSPVVADGKVVMHGVRGKLSCLDASTGKVLWRKDEFPEQWPQFFTASSPIVVDKLCIAQLGSGATGGIVAYDLATGELKWKWTSDGTAYASPVLLTVGGARQIATLTEGNIVILAAADGKVTWQAPFVAQRRAYNAATPLVEGETLIYTGSGRGTRAAKLEKQGDAWAAKELWANADIAVQFNSPVLKNGLVFGLTAGSELFCLNGKDGKTAWTAPTGARGGFGSVVDAGSVLVALTPKSELLVFEPSGQEYKQLASYKVADTETYAYPVLAGDRIYIKDQESLTLWTVQ